LLITVCCLLFFVGCLLFTFSSLVGAWIVFAICCCGCILLLHLELLFDFLHITNCHNDSKSAVKVPTFLVSDNIHSKIDLDTFVKWLKLINSWSSRPRKVVLYDWYILYKTKINFRTTRVVSYSLGKICLFAFHLTRLVFDALKDPSSSDPAVPQITRMCFKINIEAFFSSYSTETYDEKTNINFQNLCSWTLFPYYVKRWDYFNQKLNGFCWTEFCWIIKIKNSCAR